MQPNGYTDFDLIFPGFHGCLPHWMKKKLVKNSNQHIYGFNAHTLVSWKNVHWRLYITLTLFYMLDILIWSRIYVFSDHFPCWTFIQVFPFIWSIAWISKEKSCLVQLLNQIIVSKISPTAVTLTHSFPSLAIATLATSSV